MTVKLFADALRIRSPSAIFFPGSSCDDAGMAKSSSSAMMALGPDFLTARFSNQRYRTGRSTSVSRVADTRPPMTTVASGRCTSAPAPWLMAIGRKPREATAAVIKTGRSRVSVPFMIKAVMVRLDSFFNRLNSVISTIPLSTATPKSAMNPTPADMLKGISRIHRESMPPIADSGMAEKIKSPYLTDPNAKYSITKMSKSANGTAIRRRFLASTRFSNCPPYLT